MLELGLLLLFVVLIIVADFAQGQREVKALERSRERWEAFNAAQQSVEPTVESAGECPICHEVRYCIHRDH